MQSTERQKANIKIHYKPTYTRVQFSASSAAANLAAAEKMAEPLAAGLSALWHRTPAAEVAPSGLQVARRGVAALLVAGRGGAHPGEAWDGRGVAGGLWVVVPPGGGHGLQQAAAGGRAGSWVQLKGCRLGCVCCSALAAGGTLATVHCQERMTQLGENEARLGCAALRGLCLRSKLRMGTQQAG